MSTISGKWVFQKSFFFSCRTHHDKTFFITYFFPYCSENASVREDRSCYLKNTWKMTKFWTSTWKNFLNKNWNFFETSKNLQECSPRYYKAIQVCFYTFLTTVLARFHRFELNPYFERALFSKMTWKFEKQRKSKFGTSRSLTHWLMMLHPNFATVWSKLEIQGFFLIGESLL